MEVITRDNLPQPLLDQVPFGLNSQGQRHRLKLSLYFPAHRSHPARRWRTARVLLNKSLVALGRALEEAELKKITVRLAEILQGNTLLQQYPRAQGYALFLDGDQVEVQALLTPCTPSFVAGACFHVLPLLRSLASEPHYRLVVLERNKGTILRRDHSGFKIELKVAFPSHSEGPAERLYPRETARDLDRIWHNVATFSETLLHVHAADPRPLGIIGEERLRRLFIEDFRPSLSRPIFFQEPLVPNQDPPQNEALVLRADQAFAIRVAKRSPCDISRLLESAAKEGRALSGWSRVSEAADQGLIECLVMGHPWASADPSTRSRAGSQAKGAPKQNPNVPAVDEVVEKVLRSGGSVLFAESQRETRLLTGGGGGAIGAVTRAAGKAHLTH